jgi:hypothetical protein
MLERPKSSKAHPLSSKERKLYAAQDPSEGPIMLVRFPDWQARLVTYIRDSQMERIKCDWEFNHCAGWAAGAVEEMTGYDFYTPFRARPIESPGDAYLSLKAIGFDSLDTYIETILVEKPLVYANRGDVVMLKTDEYQGLGMAHALGIAEPPFAYFLTPEGVGLVPFLDCARCFAVGSLG